MCGNQGCCIMLQLLSAQSQIKTLQKEIEEGKRWEGLYKAEQNACNSWRTSANYQADKAKKEQERHIKAVSALKTLITELKENQNAD